MDYLDEPLIGAGLLSIDRRIDNLHSNVVLQNLSHESVNSGTGTGDKWEQIGAVPFLVERTLDRLNLALQAPKAFDYHGLLSNGIRHGVIPMHSFLQNSLQTARCRILTVEVRSKQLNTSMCTNTHRKNPNGSST